MLYYVLYYYFSSWVLSLTSFFGPLRVIPFQGARFTKLQKKSMILICTIKYYTIFYILKGYNINILRQSVILMMTLIVLMRERWVVIETDDLLFS